MSITSVLSFNFNKGLKEGAKIKAKNTPNINSEFKISSLFKNILRLKNLDLVEI